MHLSLIYGNFLQHLHLYMHTFSQMWHEWFFVCFLFTGSCRPEINHPINDFVTLGTTLMHFLCIQWSIEAWRNDKSLSYFLHSEQCSYYFLKICSRNIFLSKVKYNDIGKKLVLTVKTSTMLLKFNFVCYN